MPIYAFRCAACGHAKDLLMKVSDPAPSVCPACGAEAFAKQVTAAGFQLKGSGWYVTDFRGDKAAGEAADKAGDKAAGADKADGGAKADGNKVESKPAAAGTTAAAAPAAAPSDKA